MVLSVRPTKRKDVYLPGICLVAMRFGVSKKCVKEHLVSWKVGQICIRQGACHEAEVDTTRMDSYSADIVHDKPYLMCTTTDATSGYLTVDNIYIVRMFTSSVSG